MSLSTRLLQQPQPDFQQRSKDSYVQKKMQNVKLKCLELLHPRPTPQMTPIPIKRLTTQPSKAKLKIIMRGCHCKFFQWHLPTLSITTTNATCTTSDHGRTHQTPTQRIEPFFNCKCRQFIFNKCNQPKINPNPMPMQPIKQHPMPMRFIQTIFNAIQFQFVSNVRPSVRRPIQSNHIQMPSNQQ